MGAVVTKESAIDGESGLPWRADLWNYSETILEKVPEGETVGKGSFDRRYKKNLLYIYTIKPP